MMNNLIIVGNGFDLAHDMKTSYVSFLKYLINEHCKNNDFCRKILRLPKGIDNFENLISSLGTRHELTKDRSFASLFMKDLLFDIPLDNWSDIESRYFKLLNTIGIEKTIYFYQKVELLNTDFEELKNELEYYLDKQQHFADRIDAYSYLLSELCLLNSLILNFNYTDTIDRLYSDEIKSSEVLHIHGELNNKLNPIIFGFAADDNDSKILIDKNNNEYLKNIKRHEYKRTNNSDRLNNYLNEKKGIDVIILGHSCGISDKLILKQIFNHKNVSSIRILFHENYKNYFNTQINICRIMNDNENFDRKIVNFLDCCKMPQYSTTDYADVEEFVKKKIDIFSSKIILPLPDANHVSN